MSNGATEASVEPSASLGPTAQEPRMRMLSGDFVYFSSSVGVHKLSNFSAARVVVEEGVFPSSEHAYQAIQKFIPDEWHRFQINGDLSTIDALDKFYKPSVATDKKKYWNRNKMVGIVPKMASNPKWANKLRLRMRKHNPEKEAEHLAEIKPLFKRILLAKYRQNPEHAKALLETGSKYLVEFGRGSKRETIAGREPLWTGLVEDGALYGHNLMGRMLMDVRDEMRREGLHSGKCAI